jgi:hypothetical protein
MGGKVIAMPALYIYCSESPRKYAGWCTNDTTARGYSEKDARLAQKLGQLQPFLAVLPQECIGQLAYFGST